MNIKNITIGFVATFLICSLSTNTKNTDSKVEKSAIIIVGTGRCGSSCISGVLNIMGVEFGTRAEYVDEFNKKGYFEDYGTANMSWNILNDELKINFWLTPRVVKWDEVSNKDELKNQVKKYLQEHFGQYPIFAVKNGCLSYLIPLYAEAAIELGYTPKILVPSRDPHAVVSSWLNHPISGGNLPKESLYYMISICLMNILEESSKYDTLQIDFHELLNQTPKAVQKLYNFIPGLKSYNQVQKEIANFIDKNLQTF